MSTFPLAHQFPISPGLESPNPIHKGGQHMCPASQVGSPDADVSGGTKLPRRRVISLCWWLVVAAKRRGRGTVLPRVLLRMNRFVALG